MNFKNIFLTIFWYFPVNTTSGSCENSVCRDSGYKNSQNFGLGDVL